MIPRIRTALFLLILLLPTFSTISRAQSDDTLNLLYWQAPSTMNPYLSTGTKDRHAASLVLEPLARYDETGTLVPWLVTDIPTPDNGGISDDLRTITWTLREDVLWSDGTPFTAEDVVFTYAYCTNEATGCAQVANFQDVESVVALDEHTVQITFSVPKPFPYVPFVGQTSPILQAAQFADCVGERAPSCTEQNFAPIGTGPYVVDEFRTNDVITFNANPLYRVAGQPHFQRVILKGGGDELSAARAVLETGEADFAWNLQIDPELLAQLEGAGRGTVVVAFGTLVERLMVNQTNPDPALGDNRSVYMDGANAHPFLTIPDVTRALSMAIDRQVLAEQLYGAAGRPTCNILPAPQIYASNENDWCLEQDIDGANALLDSAGIVDTDGDGIRETPDGVPLEILYQTSTNTVRQSTQALIKDWWEQIGVDTELRNIDPAVFFGGDPASPDTFGKFYADIEMYAASFDGVDPENYMASWGCENISGPENNFLGRNIPRHCDPAYDALIEEYSRTVALEERARLARTMNDILIQNGAIIPLIHRGNVSAHANDIAGVRMNAWDSQLWNIAAWRRVE